MSAIELSSEEITKRHVPLPGTYNVRDLGGYQTSDGSEIHWATLYRGDALHRLDEVAQEMLVEMGIHTVIDLREEGELESAPNRLGDGDIVTLHIPIFEGRAITDAGGVRQWSLEDTYTMAVNERARALVEAVQAIAQDGVLPAIVHCTAGKDRTGMVVALVLSVLGVPDEMIAADFAVTAHHLGGEFREDILQRVRARGVAEESVVPLLSAEPVLILDFLANVRAHSGDVRGFLIEHGMTSEGIDRLRSLLLAGNE